VYLAEDPGWEAEDFPVNVEDFPSAPEAAEEAVEETAADKLLCPDGDELPEFPERFPLEGVSLEGLLVPEDPESSDMEERLLSGPETPLLDESEQLKNTPTAQQNAAHTPVECIRIYPPTSKNLIHKIIYLKIFK